MFVLQEKKKRPSGEKGKKYKNQGWFVTYRATRFTYREMVHLGEDRGHTVPMFLLMDQADDGFGQFDGQAMDRMASVVGQQDFEAPT